LLAWFQLPDPERSLSNRVANTGREEDIAIARHARRLSQHRHDEEARIGAIQAVDEGSQEVVAQGYTNHQFNQASCLIYASPVQPQPQLCVVQPKRVIMHTQLEPLCIYR
jgi:hypothetical protein